jgi:hypothetical protein
VSLVDPNDKQFFKRFHLLLGRPDEPESIATLATQEQPNPPNEKPEPDDDSKLDPEPGDALEAEPDDDSKLGLGDDLEAEQPDDDSILRPDDDLEAEPDVDSKLEPGNELNSASQVSKSAPSVM